jgi:hypothetical protein
VSSETIERVLELLIGAGYQRLTKPLEVSSVRFDFPLRLSGGSAFLTSWLASTRASNLNHA